MPVYYLLTAFLGGHAYADNSVNNLLFGVTNEDTPIDLRQSTSDTPGLVTTITAEDIKRFDIRTLQQLLRYVPGFNVNKSDGGRYDISYHDSSNARIQMLVNGRAQSVSVLSFNPWHLIPVPISKIDRVNVYRGPAASHFGSEAFSAVIDVITKQPQYSDNTVNISYDQNNILKLDTTINFEVSESQYSLSLLYDRDEGYDVRRDRVTEDTNTDTIRDSDQEPTLAESLGLALSHQWRSDKTSLHNDIHLSQGSRDKVKLGETSAEDVTNESERYVIGSTLKNRTGRHNHRFDFQYSYYKNDDQFKAGITRFFYWELMRRLSLQNREYALALLRGEVPTGGSPEDDALRDAVLFRIATEPDALDIVSGDFQTLYKDTNISLGYQDTIELDSARVLFGLNGSRITTDSESLFQGKVTRNSLSNNIYVEYKVNRFTFNTGYDAEWNSSTDETTFSPMLGINYKSDNQSGVKLLFSRANHAPDLVLTDLKWQYEVENLSSPVDGSTTGVPFLLQEPRQDLKSEINDAINLSYFKEGEKYFYEIGVFYEEKTDLYSDRLDYFTANPNNDGSITTQGIEGELRLDRPLTSYRLGFSYTEHDTDFIFEEAYLSKGSVYAQYALKLPIGDLSLSTRYTDYDFFDDVTGQLMYKHSHKVASHHRGQFTVGVIYDNNFNRRVQSVDSVNNQNQYEAKGYDNEWRLYTRYSLAF